MNRVFLDTNILIDFLNEKRENHLLAVEMLVKFIEDDYEIYISEDMLSTIYYLVKDKQKVLKFFYDIIDEWNIVSFDRDVILEAIEFSLNKNKDFEDVLECFTAKKYDCVLITNDKSFVNCGIKITGYKGDL